MQYNGCWKRYFDLLEFWCRACAICAFIAYQVWYETCWLGLWLCTGNWARMIFSLSWYFYWYDLNDGLIDLPRTMIMLLMPNDGLIDLSFIWHCQSIIASYVIICGYLKILSGCHLFFLTFRLVDQCATFLHLRGIFSAFCCTWSAAYYTAFCYWCEQNLLDTTFVFLSVNYFSCLFSMSSFIVWEYIVPAIINCCICTKPLELVLCLHSYWLLNYV